MKKILLVSTGGAILQTHTDTGIAISDDNSFKEDTFVGILNYFKNKLKLEKIDSITIMNKDSSNIISKNWELIVDLSYDKYDDYDAFIITHGTNTMGYTTAAVPYAVGNLMEK